VKLFKINLTADDNKTEGDTVTEEKVTVKEPDLFKVILLNDDFTPMDFVVEVLRNVFHHDAQSANEIMLDVHEQGAGTAGVFTFGVAETKVYIVNNQAKKYQFPLKCIMEKE